MTINNIKKYKNNLNMNKITIYTKEKVYNFTSDKDKNYIYAVKRAHREDGPAYIWYFEDGNIKLEFWYINGKLHREDGPAKIWYNKNGNIEYEEYYLNDKKYREDGPAVISYDINGNIKNEIYYLNDKKYSFDDWKKKVKVKEIKLKSQAELMKQMAKDKVPYNGQEYYISTTSNKPIVYTIKESKVFESFKESFNK